MKEIIYFALVGVIALEDNMFLSKNKNAYVRVACKISIKDDLQKTLKEIFKSYHFEVFEITDIEKEEFLNTEQRSNSVTKKLISEINNGYKFAWGTFHTFSDF